MSDAAPKPWVKALRIKSTPWRVLVGLWGHGSYKADGPAFVWVNRRKLADEVGLPLGTLRNGLDALAVLGWIVRDGGGWRLAWMTPGNFTRPADGPTRPTGEPARPQADPVRGESDPARPQAGPRPARGPHNVVENFQLPSNQVGDASARPPTPSPEERHDRVENHNHRDPAEHAAHGAGLEAARSLGRADDAGEGDLRGARGAARPGRDEARTARGLDAAATAGSLPDHVQASLTRATGAGDGERLQQPQRPATARGVQSAGSAVGDGHRTAGATGNDTRGTGGHRGRGDSAAAANRGRATSRRPGVGDRLSPELAERIEQSDLEEQARIERIAARRAHGPDEAAQAFESAVAQVGVAWSQLIQDRPSWRQGMHKARVDENLTPVHGRRICEAWDTEAEGGVKPGQPGRSKIWGGWSTDAEWRRKAAGLAPAVQLYAVPDEREPIDDPWDGHGDVGS